jgi:hypothetical protein
LLFAHALVAEYIGIITDDGVMVHEIKAHQGKERVVVFRKNSSFGV